MLNHVEIMGRLVRDPDLRYTQSNVPVVSFTLAVDRDFGKTEAGDKQTDFIDCVAWRSTAEFISKYFFKARMAVVSGRLQMRDWTDKEGNKRRNAEVIVDNIYFGDSRRDGDNTASSASSSSEGQTGGTQFTAAAAAAPSPFQELEDDGELPF